MTILLNFVFHDVQPNGISAGKWDNDSFPIGKKIKKTLQWKCSCASFFPKTQDKEQEEAPSKNVIEYKVILQRANLLVMANFRIFLYDIR